MSGPVDQVGQSVAKGDTVVICISGKHYSGQVVDVHEPGLIAASGSIPPAGQRGGQVQAMEMAGMVSVALVIHIPYVKQRPQVDLIKVNPPRDPRPATA